MTMPSNAIKAERAILRMPLGSWIDVKAIGKDAQLGTSAMAKFLLRASRNCVVERKIVVKGSAKLHLWRRIV